MKKIIGSIITLVLALFAMHTASAAILYWDSNGVTAGAGATPTGNWATSTFWSTASDGTATPGAWVGGSDAVFSAGTDAVNLFSATPNAPIAANSITVEEGAVNLTSQTVTVSAGGVLVNSGAKIRVSTAAQLGVSGTPNFVLDGGTYENAQVPGASTFMTAAFKPVVTANGGTFSAIAVTGTFFATMPSTSISGSGPVTFTGGNCAIRCAVAQTYTGPTIISNNLSGANRFEFRQNTAVNMLPTTTQLTIASGGVYNLGAAAGVTTIGSLSGAGQVAYAGASQTLDINMGAGTNTTFSGIIQNSFTTFGAAAGTFGRINKRGAGSLTLSGVNTYDGFFTNAAGTTTVNLGGMLCAAGADVVVTAGTLNLNNAAQTVLSLTGAGGTVNLGTGHTLTVNNGTAKSSSSTIAGAGALVKTAAGAWTLTKANTFAGGLTISGGSIVYGIDNAIPQGTGKGNVSVAGAIDLNDFNGTVNGLTGAGNVTNSAGASIFTVGGANASSTFGGIIRAGTGTIAVTKTGTGTIVLSGANTYTDVTTINNGTLRIDGSIVSTTTVNNNGNLGGNGTVGPVTVNSGGAIAPGASVGTLTTVGAVDFASGSKFKVEMSDATVSEGVNQDFLNVGGALSFAGTCTIVVSGVATGFDDTVDYVGGLRWRIATASGGIDISGATFAFDTTGFTPSTGTGSFRVVQSGDDLYLEFVHPPNVSAFTIGGSFNVGDSANFSVTATGTGTLAYQWKKNGNDLDNETTSAFSIGSVALTDAGTYSVDVTGDFPPVASPSGVLAIRPTITSPPVSSTNNPGDSVTFTVVAEGSGTLGYQWKKDGANIPNATGTSLTIDPIAGVDAAEEPGYSVTVTNNSDASATAAAILRVTPDIITTLPANIYAFSGDVTLTIAATGTTNLYYTWFKNDVALYDEAKYGGTNEASLTITNVAVGTDDGTYSVVVSNIVGTATNSTVLTVSLIPVITAQPQSRTNAAGTEATFTVTAIGQPPLYYIWQKDGGEIGGATDATLTLSGVATIDQAGYTVIVSNEVAAVPYTTTSAPPATLTVYYPVTATGPTDQTVVSNTTATFTTAVTSTENGPITYQWKRSGTNLVEGAKYANTTTDTLSISNALTTDNGAYSVVLANFVGSITNSANLTVINPVVITAQPTNKTVGIGSNAVFSVTAVGTTPTYQWQTNGVDIDLATTASYTNLASNHDHETLDFTVIVSNFAGAVTSAVANVIVHDLPVIITQPLSRTNDAGTDADFTVVATGQSLTYNWRRNTTSYANDVNATGATTDTLTINDVTLADQRTNINVVVANVAGSVTSDNVSLVVYDAASISVEPSDLSVRPGTSATFSATAVGNPLTYQWSKNGIEIAGATGSSYTAANVQNTSFGYYSAVISNQFNVITTRQAVLSARYAKLWEVAPGARSYLNAANNFERGLAYNAATDHILVPSRTATPAALIGIVNPHTGADLGVMDVTGVTGGTFVLNQIVVADDGVIYGCNLVTSGNIKIYRWANEGATPTVAFNATITAVGPTPGTRWGDRLTVRGSGNGTQLLVSGGASDTSLALLTTTDSGASFTATALNAVGSSVGDFFGNLFFSTGNSFYSKSYTGGILKYWSYSGATATLVSSITGFDANLVGMSTNTADNLAYGVTFQNTLQIFDMAGGDANRKIVNYSMPANNTSSGGNGQVLDGPSRLVIGMVTHNGLLALTNQVMPLITADPANVSTNAGSTVVFTATADQPLAYIQWQKDGVPIPGETGTTLTLNNVLNGDEGTYSGIVVTEVGPVQSGGGTLTVNEPYINTQPASGDFAAGADATFTVVASGTALTYQWKKDGTNLTDVENITGSTTASLTVGNVATPDDVASYTVAITNDVLEGVISDPATLNIIEAPTVNVTPGTTNILQGGSATFTANTSGGALSFQWYHGATLLAGKTGNTLTVTGVQPADTNDGWTVVVSNVVDVVTSTPPALITLTIDANRPTVGVTTPKVGGGIGTSAVTLTGSVKDLSNGGLAANSGIITAVEYRYNPGNVLLAESVTNTAALTDLTKGKWSFTSTNDLILLPGTNIVHVWAYDLAGNKGTNLNPFFVFYDVTNNLVLKINGTGTGTGVKVNGVIYNGPSTNVIVGKFKVGRPYVAETFVLAGNNSVFTNWTASPTNIGHSTNTWVQKSKLPFVMQPAMTLTAQFNADPYPAVLGNYYGLFYESGGVTHETAGHIQVTVKKKAGYSGTMLFDGNKVKFSGKFNADGTVNTQVVRSNFNNKLPVQLAMGINFDSESIGGTVSNETWVSDLYANKQVFFKNLGPFDTTNAGSYTFQLPSDLIDEPNGPKGVSFAWLTNSPEGIMKYGGQMADGSKFTGKMNISREGALPFYVPLYKNVTPGPALNEYKGSVLGWLNFDDADFDGVNTLSWIKKDGSEYQAIYGAGFTNNVALVGSPYVPPLPLNLPITVNPLDRIIVTDGNLLQPVTNLVTVSALGKVKLAPLNTALFLNKAAISFKAKDGTFAGAFLDGLNKRITKGVVLQNTGAAAGHFVGTSESGTVILAPAE